MLRCMYSGISGMKVNQQKLDVIGNNIANAGTTAFKSSRAEFSDMLYQSTESASSPTSTKGGTNSKQVGLGAKLSSIDTVMSQGNALSTGRTLDVCVDGDGYLIIGNGSITASNEVSNNAFTESGGTTGNTESLDILYTRDGNLKLDYQGNLLTSDGYRVMGYNVGGALTYDDTDGITAQFVSADDTSALTTDDTLVPLAIPDKVEDQAVSSFEIGTDGLIVAILGDGTRSVLGQIAMANFKNPEGLTSLGGNKYQISSNSGEAIIRSAIDKTADGEDNSKAFGDIVQGCLEASNVDLTEQFTDMITATRSFQAASKMITTGDEILQTITGLMR